jgi:hypothetical protein
VFKPSARKWKCTGRGEGGGGGEGLREEGLEWGVSVDKILLFGIRQMRRRAGDVISLEDTRKRSYHRQVCIEPTVQSPHHILLVLIVWFE